MMAKSRRVNPVSLITLFAVVFLGFAVAAVAQKVISPAEIAPIPAPSQPPPSSGSEPSGSSRAEAGGREQPTAPDQRGTEQSPLVVKIISPPKSDEKSDYGGDTGKGDAAGRQWFNELGTGDKIATIAALVGFLQFAALVATYWVMRRIR
jgi:hypothetical protein